MKRLIFTTFVVIINVVAFAQNNNEYKVRKMETYGYASASVSPNIINTSFVIKEFNENGKIITIKESEELIKNIIKSLHCINGDLTVGNIFGYVSYTGENNEQGKFEHRRMYLLQFRDVDGIDSFLDAIDPRAFESFNIDEMENYELDLVSKDLQKRAFLNAKDKATELLKTYGEECGKVLDIKEISAEIIYPDFTGNGSNIKRFLSSNINEESHTGIKSKDIRLAYQVMVTFELK